MTAVSQQVTCVINPEVGCHYFPPGLQLPSQEGCYQFRCLVNRGMMGVNSLPKTVTRQRCSYALNLGPSAPASSTLTTRQRSNPCMTRWQNFQSRDFRDWGKVLVRRFLNFFTAQCSKAEGKGSPRANNQLDPYRHFERMTQGHWLVSSTALTLQPSAGLTMWQMANATGLGPQGASGSRENFFSPSVVK